MLTRVLLKLAHRMPLLGSIAAGLYEDHLLCPSLQGIFYEQEHKLL